MTIASKQDEFLRTHRWALVGTVGPSQSPHVTMVAYHWDGTDVVISLRNTATKWRNLQRNPQMTVTVADDLLFLTLSGIADLVTEDPLREQLTRRLQASLLPSHQGMLDAELARGLDATGRVVIRLRPEHAVGRV